MTPLDELFDSVLLREDDIPNVLVDDIEDEVLEHYEENRKISIFDAEFVLEGEE